MSVTRDTSHSPIGPCGPWEQPPLGDSSRHAFTAMLSSVLDCGAKASDRAVSWIVSVGKCGLQGLHVGRLKVRFNGLKVNFDGLRVRFWERETRKSSICICARTSTGIRWSIDKEHKKQDPKMQRQTNLRVPSHAHMRECVCVCVPVSVYLHERTSSRVTYINI